MCSLFLRERRADFPGLAERRLLGQLSWLALGRPGQEGGSDGDSWGPAERRQSPPCLCGQESGGCPGPLSASEATLLLISVLCVVFSFLFLGHSWPPIPEFSSGQMVSCPQGLVTLVRGVQRGPCKVIDSEHGWEGPGGRGVSGSQR